MIMKDRAMFTSLILFGLVACLTAKTVTRPPYRIPTAKPPSPTISPSRTPPLPKGINQQRPFQGFMFPNLQSTSTPLGPPTPKPSVCQPITPVISRSQPCSQPALRKIELSDEDLSYVLSDEGGSYVQQYMAVEQTEASRNFKNMISLNEMYEDHGSDQHTLNWKWNYSLTKSKIIEHLDKAYAEFYASTISPNKLNVLPFGIDLSKTAMKNIFQNSKSFPSSSSSSSRERTEEKQNLNGSHSDWDLHHFRKRYASRALEDSAVIPNHILDQIVPAQKFYTENERVKRDSTGAVSRAEYCTQRGEQTTDGYLHMCTTCSHTTTLSDDKFPRIINEAVCHSTERACMFLGTTPHGSCHQNVMYMTMLRRKAGSCMMVIHSGDQVLTDEWELYSQPIRVSCECRVDKRSPFAKYINPN